MKLGTREFERQVADALEHLWDLSYLGQHSFARLNCVTRRLPQHAEVSHIDKGRAVNEAIVAAIENLKPVDGQGGFSREKDYYTVLTKAYIEGIDNKMIAASLYIGERTLYRHHIKAIQVVAQILRDWEVQST